jgi:hypothetical protein
MTSEMADHRKHVDEAERRLLATVPRTTAWLDAQRDAIRARADYWDALRDQWNLNNPKPPNPHGGS